MKQLPAGYTLDDSNSGVLPEGFTLDVDPNGIGQTLPDGFTIDPPVDTTQHIQATEKHQQQQMTHGEPVSNRDWLLTERAVKNGIPLNVKEDAKRFGVEPKPYATSAAPKTMLQRFMDNLAGSHGAVNPESQAKAVVAFNARQHGQTAKEFTEEVGARTGPLERGLKDATAGAISSGAGMLGYIARLSGEPAAQDLFERADIKAQDLMPSDPNFMDQLMAGFGSTATFFIPGMGIAKGAQAIGSVAPRMALWLGAGAAAGLEASAEAGQTYEQMLGEGKGQAAAQRAADQVFWGNAALVGITNRLGLFGDHGGQLTRRSFGAAMEGGQEGGQQMIANVAQDKPTMEGVGESMAVGAIVGGTMSGSFKGEQPPEKHVEHAKDYTAQTIERAIEGMEGDDAQLQNQADTNQAPISTQPPIAAMKEPTQAPSQELPEGFVLDEAPPDQIEAMQVPPKTPADAGVSVSMPETISSGPATIETTPIGGTVFRETDAEGLFDILLGDKNGRALNVFVSDDVELAIGQGSNQGIVIEMEGSRVSGTKHNKPGTNVVGGGEYQTNYMGADAIQKITVAPNIKIDRGLSRRLLSERFERNERADGSVVYVKQPTLDHQTFDSQPPHPDQTNPMESQGIAKEDAIVRDHSDISFSDDTLNAPGAHYQPLYQSGAVTLEPSNTGTMKIGEKVIALPKASKPMRRESIRAALINIIGPRLYEGKIKGKGRLGYYRHSNSEIRVQKHGDVEVLAHEMAHYLDFHYKYNKQFKEAYSIPEHLKEIKPLSYTDDKKLAASEGFAEFVRLWLTRYDAAKMYAPKFTQKFEQVLARDPKLRKRMDDLQERMHKWYGQGSEARLAAVMNGKKLTPRDRMNEVLVSRPLELIRQKNIDHIHAAKVIERETQGELLDATNSPFKQLQLINGLEGIFEESLRKGAPYFNKEGAIQFKGPSILDVFGDSIKIGQDRFEKLQQYFVARRARELMQQGRENLLDEDMIRAGLAHAAKWPSFSKKFAQYQEYRSNLMDFMVSTGYLEPKAAKAMKEKNKNYVPFNRVVEGVGESFAGSSNFKRLKGGSQNLKNIFENIVMGDFEHIKGALRAKALRDMYEMGLSSQEGGKFFSRIAPDSKPVQSHINQMVDKVANAMGAMDIAISKDGLIMGGNLDGPIVDVSSIKSYFEQNTEELMFWTYGNKPKTTETKVDSYVNRNGDRVWLEFQKDSELVTDMLDNLNGWALPKGIAGTVLGAAYSVKNFMTYTITTMPQFSIPNLVRDIQQAFLLSGGQFKPVYHNMVGFASMLGHAMGKNTAYSEMMANGGGWGTRVRGTLQDTAHGVGFRMPGRWSKPELFLSNILDLYVSLIDSPEMSTRVGFYIQQRSKGKSAREAAWQAREISTDFRKHGSYAPFVMLQRTIPFHGAFVQSVDRDIRGFTERKGETKLTNLFKTESGKLELQDLKVRMAIVGASFASIVLLLASMNEDDDWYQNLTVDERVRFFHLKINGEHYTVPKGHGFFQMVLQAIEAFMDYTTQKEGADVAKVMAYSLAYNLNSDFLPGVVNPAFEYGINENFTGAPIISKGQEKLSPALQYTDQTPQVYVQLGEMMNISPDGTRHIMRGYTGYLENFISDTADAALWNEQEWGDRPFKSGAREYFGKQFKPREVPYRTRWVEKYYDAKGRALTAQADLNLIKKRMDVDPKLRKRFNHEPTHLLSELNKQFSIIDGTITEMREASVRIRYDKALSAEQKEGQINAIRKEKNEMIKDFYKDVVFDIEKLEKQLDKHK